MTLKLAKIWHFGGFDTYHYLYHEGGEGYDTCVTLQAIDMIICRALDLKWVRETHTHNVKTIRYQSLLMARGRSQKWEGVEKIFRPLGHCPNTCSLVDRQLHNSSINIWNVWGFVQEPASDFSVLRNADIIELQLPAVLACFQYWLYMILTHCTYF